MNDALRIRIVCPARPGSRHGNRVTALRWQRILRGLGHRVVIAGSWTGEPCDLLIALHARRSAASAAAFARAHPDRPLLVALPGPAVYRDLATSRSARRSLELATRLVALQPLAARELPRAVRDKVRVIHQSAPPVRARPSPTRKTFDVCVLGHLRPEKDPLRTAKAARLLPASSRVAVIHVGKALSPAMERAARREAEANPRYRWLGERPRARALAIMARSRLLVLSSRLEGGANVVTEALAAGVPILASRIPGSTGLLGTSYPGLFPVGDAPALARLLARCEVDRAFLAGIRRACRARASIASPAGEVRAWRRLLAEIGR